MKPSQKHESLDRLLTDTFGVDRIGSIKESFCVAPPIGCGLLVEEAQFKNLKSLEEYRISGLCQECQDSIFNCEEF